MNILITLCARGGSKGIPGKNVRMINGRHLMALSIDIAKLFAYKFSGDIILSTDDIRIKEVAAQYGIHTTYSRPEHLATDGAGKLETIADALHFEETRCDKKYDFILDLDITSPLRNMKDLESAFAIIREDPRALDIFSVNPAARNPYFNMVEQQDNSYYGLIKKGYFKTRQSAPKVYDLNASFYFFRRAFFNQKNPSTINELSLIYEMPHICFDLDHPIDFEFMEYLFVNNKLGFEL